MIIRNIYKLKNSNDRIKSMNASDSILSSNNYSIVNCESFLGVPSTFTMSIAPFCNQNNTEQCPGILTNQSIYTNTIAILTAIPSYPATGSFTYTVTDLSFKYNPNYNNEIYNMVTITPTDGIDTQDNCISKIDLSFTVGTTNYHFVTSTGDQYTYNVNTTYYGSYPITKTFDAFCNY